MNTRRNYLLLDLDNTLVDSKQLIYPEIEERMRSFILNRGLCDEASATLTLTRAARLGHGITVVGLARMFPIEPYAFLEYCHPLALVAQRFRPSHGLTQWIARAPGVCVIASDGPSAYCKAAVTALGIERWVSKIISIDRMGYIPKADPRYFKVLRQKFGLGGPNCTLVDDRHECIASARSSGMKAVHVTTARRLPKLVPYT